MVGGFFIKDKMNELAISSENKLSLGKFYFDKTGLTVNGNPTFEEWQNCGEFLKQAEKSVQFWIGDWLNYGERKYGETYSQAMDQTGQEYQTVANQKYVSSKVEISLRRENLTFGHHALVAPMLPKEQSEWLDKAEKENLSIADLRHEIKQARLEKQVSMPSDKYRVIYADPPWLYTSGDQHSREEQDTVLGDYYPSMSIAELCNLPIYKLADDNSVLFLWVTSPLLEECFDVIKAWGFEYKTSIIWDKDAHNVGHYVSVRHELLLICTRGSCKPDSGKLLPSVVKEKRTEHSVKPETFRSMIDEMYPYGKRIELFARKQVEGWEAWGNEPKVN